MAAASSRLAASRGRDERVFNHHGPWRSKTTTPARRGMVSTKAATMVEHGADFVPADFPCDVFRNSGADSHREPTLARNHSCGRGGFFHGLRYRAVAARVIAVA